MLTSADDDQPTVTVRKFRLGGGQDTDNSDSEDEEGGAAPRWRGGAGAVSTSRSPLLAPSLPAPSPIAAAADSASVPSRAGSSSSLELSSTSSSMPLSPARPALTSGLGKPITAAIATAAPADLQEEKRRGSSSSSKDGNASETNGEAGKRERGGSGTAQRRQQLKSRGWTVSASMTSTIMGSAKEEKTKLAPRRAATGDAAAVLPAASTSPAPDAHAVQPQWAAADVFFRRKNPSSATAVEVEASTTSLSITAAAGMPQATASITATATRSRPALQLAVAPVPASISSARSTTTEAALTAAAAVASPPVALEAPLAAPLSSSSSGGAKGALPAPVRVACPTSTGPPSGSVATATQCLPTRQLSMPSTTAVEEDTPSSSPPPGLTLPSATQPSTAAAAAGQTVTSAAVPTASLHASAAVPGSGGIVSGSGSPVLSGPGGVAYNRVNAQGRGSVPSRMLEAPSQPRWRALPREHMTPSSFPTVAARPAATLASPLPPPELVIATEAAHAEAPSPVVACASPLFALPPSVSPPARPRRRAPRLPGVTHTSAALSLIEDDEAQRRCGSSPVASALSTERSSVEAGQPKVVSARQRGPLESRAASPLLPLSRAHFMSPEGGAPSSAGGAPSPLLSRFATVTAAQRERETALLIYDDRVPPAQRRAKRQAMPLTGRTAEGYGAESVSAWLLLLREPRATASQEGEREDALRWCPILHIGRGAASRTNHADCFSESHLLDGEDDDDGGCVDVGASSTCGPLGRAVDSHGSYGANPEQGRYPQRQPSGDRSAKVKRHSSGIRTVQRLCGGTQQHSRCRSDLDALISHTGSREPLPCVVLRSGRQAASAAGDVNAEHKDVGDGDPLSAVSQPATALALAAASLLADDAVNVDVLS
ncbi:hypothetical protein LSCM1_05097 [Leishmania martiniquensis]|uniref:Uncharacterized protein n=1 Tax=Leishmania martiniquensis TaxID=1580590 RepID=A0A836HAA2_9TRYP|nr:hypothetical protein LSCM1_05097 [Leishmania martiniquensis]